MVPCKCDQDHAVAIGDEILEEGETVYTDTCPMCLDTVRLTVKMEVVKDGQ